jgi:MFS family permease
LVEIGLILNRIAKLSPIKSFNRSARLFLLATIINGVIFSAWQLFFNFFILARGFEKDFLGLVNSAPSMAALVFGILLGMVSDRIGQRRAMLVGLTLASLAMGSQLLVNAPALIVLMAFLGGLGNSLYYISIAPFMMKVSSQENRTLLFSLNFGLVTISGSVGNLFAGQLPAFFSRVLQVPAQSAEAYQAVLLSAVITGSLCLIPIFLIREHKSGMDIKSQIKRKPVQRVLFQPLVMKLIFPNLLIGFGAAILIPYMNIFYSERFLLSDESLGVLFSSSALLMGASSLLGPRLAKRIGSKIRTIVITQGASIVFLILMGFSPVVWLSAIGFLMRFVLMNVAAPLYSAFSMEQVQAEDQGTVNSLLIVSWQVGWAVGPYLSGIIQSVYGFNPLFVAMASLYAISILFTWLVFRDTEQISAGQASLNPGMSSFATKDNIGD